MQYTRLERIIQLLTDCLPPLQHLDQCIKHYTILLQNRNLVVLDIIDTYIDFKEAYESIK